MESYDPAAAARVWQRVRAPGGSVPQAEELMPLIAGEWENAAVYLRLSREKKGGLAAPMERLFQQTQAIIACLKGMYVLSTGRQAVVRAAVPEKGPIQAALRRCYRNCLEQRNEYRRRAADPEYGPAFEDLAEKKQEHCRLLLELAGSLE